MKFKEGHHETKRKTTANSTTRAKEDTMKRKGRDRSGNPRKWGPHPHPFPLFDRGSDRGWPKPLKLEPDTGGL